MILKLNKKMFLYHSGTLQPIVVGTAELIENAARLKFSNLAKGLFSAHQEKLNF